MFVTYHLKGLEESYNFVVESTSIKIYLQSYDHTKFRTQLFHEEHGCSPCNLNVCSPSTV